MATDSEPKKVEVQDSDWAGLRQHLNRGGLITVSQDLELGKVGVHAAEDDRETIADWIEEGKLRKPTPEEIEYWESEPEREFRFVIVQPFVLIQPKAQ